MPDAGASGTSAGDLLGLGALLPGCVTGSTQEHRQTAVCPGQHLHRACSEGTNYRFILIQAVQVLSCNL